MARSAALLGAVLLALFSGCAKRTLSVPGPAKADGGVSLFLTASKTEFAPGEPIVLTAELWNANVEALTIPALDPGSPQTGWEGTVEKAWASTVVHVYPMPAAPEPPEMWSRPEGSDHLPARGKAQITFTLQDTVHGAGVYAPGSYTVWCEYRMFMEKRWPARGSSSLNLTSNAVTIRVVPPRDSRR